MRRFLSALALSGAVLLGGCQNPDGSTDWGNTLLLGAGIGAATALVAGAATNSPPRHHGRAYGYGAPRYAQGYGYGYPRGYRGW
jgi:drug/metabolite transporter (DMT)-like permease